MKKIIYATVKIIVADDADIDDIVANAEYTFRHPQIHETEWIGVNDNGE